MSKVFRTFMAFALSAVAVFAFTGCSSQESYTPSLKSAQVSSPTIHEDGVLKVGVNASKSPLAGAGNDSIIGIDVDIAAALADELGLKLEVIDVQSDYATALNNGTIDIALGIDSSESGSDFWTSETYLPSCAALFTLESSSVGAPTTSSAIRAAAQVSSKSAWAVMNLFSDATLVSRADLSSALDALSTGSADYLAADAVIGMYAANRAGVDVKLVAMLDSKSGYCIAMSETNTELQNLIKNSLNTLLSNGTVDLIETKWLGSTVDLDSAVNLSSTSSSSTSSSSTSTTNTTSSTSEDSTTSTDSEDSSVQAA